MLLVLEPKRVTVDQLPYHCLPQLSPLAAVAVDPKEQMAQQAEMVVEADTAIMLEPQAQLEDSQVAMPMAMVVAEAEAQEPQALQEAREEMVAMAC
jgi:hypothetical protein